MAPCISGVLLHSDRQPIVFRQAAFAAATLAGLLRSLTRFRDARHGGLASTDLFEALASVIGHGTWRCTRETSGTTRVLPRRVSPLAVHGESRMNHRHALELHSFVLPLAAFILLGLSPLPVRADSCETGDPCTVGTCLADGTCDQQPGNDGASCDTFNSCTTGTCSNGTCAETNKNDGVSCDTFDACMQKSGHCSAGTCSGPALADGVPCRQDVLGPCVSGTCTTISTITFCSPEFPCGQPTPCDLKCNPENGNCEAFPTHVCDDACSTATCTPDGDFGHTCTNAHDKADNTPCNQCGACTSGECVGVTSGGNVCGDGNVGGSEECDDGDTTFTPGQPCSATCTLVPCGKPTNSSGGAPKTSDALFALKAAVKSATCDLSLCDVNNSGTITTSDALIILKKAVGQLVTLNCPAA